jgi:hypothetical protein
LLVNRAAQLFPLTLVNIWSDILPWEEAGRCCSYCVSVGRPAGEYGYDFFF